MKKSFLQIIALALVLIFVASVSLAYIAPTGTAGVTNTDGPLLSNSTDQTKAGGLAVGTFQAQKSSLFQQNTFFDGSIRGGTPTNNLGVPVKFGGPANKVDALLTGNMVISGTYQSDTLKTGGGKKPLCADGFGVLYICGTTPPAPVAGQKYVTLSLKFNPDGSGNSNVYAALSTSIEKDVTVHASAKKGSGSTGLVSFLKNFYTANAFITPGVCPLSTSYTPIQTLTIYAGTVKSSEIGLPPGCNDTNTDLIITSYSPVTSVKGPIYEAGN